MSKAHIVCGMTDTGKSYYIKNQIRNVPNKQSLYIYDINNEYKEFFDYELIDFEDFAYNCTLLSNAIIVLEEATIFLDGRLKCDQYIQTVLTRKKHTKNYIFLVFHSVAQIPPYVYQLCNYITLFKTNDLPDMSARELRDLRLRDFMQRIKANPDIHYYETMRII